MTLWLFGVWALFGILFVVQIVIRGKASPLNRPVELGPLEHPVRWFVTGLSWWRRLGVLVILAAVGYGCVVDATTRLIVAVTITAMAAVTLIWRRRHARDRGAAG